MIAVINLFGKNLYQLTIDEVLTAYPHRSQYTAPDRTVGFMYNNEHEYFIYSCSKSGELYYVEEQIPINIKNGVVNYLDD